MGASSTRSARSTRQGAILPLGWDVRSHIVPLLQGYFYHEGERLQAVLGKPFLKARLFAEELFARASAALESERPIIELRSYGQDDEEFLNALRQMIREGKVSSPS